MLEEDPDAIKRLVEIYVKIDKESKADPAVKEAAAEWFRRMESGEEEVLKNWRLWRSLSLKKYVEEYERLNVKFDVYTSESEVKKEGMDEALEQLKTKGLLEETQDGGLLLNLEKYKLGKAVVKKRSTSCSVVFLLIFLIFPFSTRWHLDLPPSRYWRRHRPLQEIQV